MIRLQLFVILFAIIGAGCGPKVFKPLYTTPPDVSAVLEVKYIAERPVPEEERSRLVISLAQTVAPNTDAYYNNPGASRNKPDTAPSVIIAVPDKATSQSLSSTEGRQESEAVGRGLHEVFRTDGYYNEAEQAIEAALLRQGFNVLDRSKFEAKLRDLRDRANDTRYWWTNYERLIENKEYDALKSLLAEQLKSGVLTQKDYIKRISEVDEISQIGLPGHKRTEDEMIDIAEVIRAAQTGSDQADYVLQINGLAVNDAENRMLNIQELPEVKSFLQANPGLKFGSLPDALPARVPSKWLRVEFNAKLISVVSGSIVWLGSHELESWAAEPIRITFDVQRKVKNAAVINGVIQKYNAELRTLINESKASRNTLTLAYTRASQEKKFKKEIELVQYRNELTDTIADLEKAHERNRVRLRRMMNSPPSVSSIPWEYTYVVSPAVVVPNLLLEGQQSAAGEKRLLRHRRELIREVTRQLIRTVQIRS